MTPLRLIYIVLFFPGLLYLFMCGFLLNETIVHESSYDLASVSHAQVKKIFLVVIDALRSDMVFSATPEKTIFQSMLKRRDKAYCEISRLQAPSVTLPRIKALTSGRVPQFVDILSNFHNSAMESDTWLTHLRHFNWHMQMYGDETWIRVFPKMFHQVDPVSSLFVKDFHEVDRNVTRHIDPVLRDMSDKELIVMHYLGLDHIGHIHGPLGEQISDKLREMNGVLERILSSLEARGTDDWMVVVTGDHGMGDKGGHGGASYEELHVPMVYLSPRFASNEKTAFAANCDFTQLNEGSQLDLSLLISLVTDTKRPMNSLGVLSPGLAASFFRGNLTRIGEFFKDNMDYFASLLACDAHGQCDRGYQLPADLLTQFLLARSHLSQVLDRHCHDQSCDHDQQTDLVQFIQRAYPLLRDAQQNLILHASEISIWQMVLFSVLIWCVNLYIWRKLYHWYCETYSQGTLPQTLKEQNWSSMPSLASLLKFCFVIVVGHAVSLLASSFVEEEHQFWYYASSTLVLLTVLPLAIWHYRHGFVSVKLLLGDLFYPTFVLVLDRLLRRLNQTGDKWINLLDLSDWFAAPENRPSLISACFGALLLIVALRFLAVARSSIRNARTCSLKNCLLWPLPALTILGVTSTMAVYRVSQWDQWSDSLQLYAARLVYLAIAVDFFISLLHWLHQRKSCFQWWPTCVGEETGAKPLVAGVQVKTTSEPISQALALLVCLLGRDTITLLWAGVLLKERLLLAYWSRISARLPQMDHTTLKMIMACQYWITGWVTFYQQGNSHSIATLDFSVSFVGLSEYNYYLCGALLAVYTFAGPCFWHIQFHSRSLILFPKWPSIKDRLVVAHFAYGMLTMPIAVYTLCCIMLRNHLFVWSVFAPKLIYFTFVTFFMTPVYLLSFCVNIF